VCDLFISTTTGVWYTKWTGTGNTGWGVGHNATARVNGDLDVTGYVSVPGYVSQLTGYRITAAGAGDFRYLYADELHAKSFIADLEQALAGGQIICKSVTSLGSNFTNPATGGTATLTVRDLPSAENVATFQSGDYVGLRVFTRTAGALTITETFGVVTAYADQAGGVQTWTFTRGTGANGGGMAASTVVATDAVVIDYGVSGNGCHEVNAIDGAFSVNSPYSQTWTWTTSPIPANRVMRTRAGNLRGISGVPGEYGIIAGTGVTSADGLILASNDRVVLQNIDLNMYASGVNTIKLDHLVPSFAIGSAVPSAYGTGTGIWMGNDGGTYKFRAGIPGGAGLFWDGATLTVRGTGGSATNILANGECRVGTEGWTIGTTSAGTPTAGTNLGGAGDYTPAYPVIESSTCFVTTSGTPAGATVTFAQAIPSFAVVASQRYELGASVGLERASTAHVQLNWRDAAGALVSSVNSATCPPGAVYRTGLAGFCRAAMVVTAPAGAVTAQSFVVMTHNGTEADPYLFFTRVFFGQATSTQTEASAWGPAGLTEITGGLIRTGTIVAGHIAAGTITATQIAANTITAAKIAAGTITATEIAASTITGAKIAAGTIAASHIGVSTLSALSANLGTVTAGTISGTTITGNTISGGSVSGVTITGGSIDISGDFVVAGDGSTYITNIDVGGQIAVTSQGGTGTGYACFSNTGVLFRSTSC